MKLPCFFVLAALVKFASCFSSPTTTKNSTAGNSSITDDPNGCQVQLPCASGGQYFFSCNRCDGRPNCLDGSDEKDCTRRFEYIWKREQIQEDDKALTILAAIGLLGSLYPLLMAYQLAYRLLLNSGGLHLPTWLFVHILGFIVQEIIREIAVPLSITL